MNFIIESVLGIIVLYILKIFLGLVSPIFSVPITGIVSNLEKIIRKDEYLPIYHTFRIDHFINFTIQGIILIFISSFLISLFPWGYHLNILSIIVIELLALYSYNAENGFWYEVSIIGGEIFGSLLSYFIFIF